MKNILLVLALVTGCAVLNRPAPLPVEAPTTTVPEVKPPVIESPAATVPKTKFRLTAEADYAPPAAYMTYAERAQKFYELVVNDKSLLGSKKFSYTSASADEIRAKIAEGFDIELRLYWPSKWKFGRSNVVAYHDDWVIRFNALKIKGREKEPCSIVNTLVHEGLHGLNFAHGDGYPTAIDNDSVPYWLGDKAEEYCLAGKI